MSKQEIFLSLILGFLGAIVGSYSSSWFEQNNWETRFEVQRKVILLEKKTKLLEELTELFVSMPRVRDYAMQLELASKGQRAISDYYKAENECNKDCKEFNSKQAKLYYKTKARLEAAFLQAHFYFGPATQQEIVNLTEDLSYKWYEPEREKINVLIAAMYSELLD